METGNCSIGLRPTSTAWIIEQIAVSLHVLGRQIVNINRSSSECHQQNSSINWRGNNAHLISCADLVFDTGAKIPRKVPWWWWRRKSMKIKTDNDKTFYGHSSGIPTFCAWHKLNSPIYLVGVRLNWSLKVSQSFFAFCTYGVLFRSPLCSLFIHIVYTFGCLGLLKGVPLNLKEWMKWKRRMLWHIAGNPNGEILGQRDSFHSDFNRFLPEHGFPIYFIGHLWLKANTITSITIEWRVFILLKYRFHCFWFCYNSS